MHGEVQNFRFDLKTAKIYFLTDDVILLISLRKCKEKNRYVVVKNNSRLFTDAIFRQEII